MAGLDPQTQINVMSEVLTLGWIISVALAYYAGKWRGELKELRESIDRLESDDSEVAG